MSKLKLKTNTQEVADGYVILTKEQLELVKSKGYDELTVTNTEKKSTVTIQKDFFTKLKVNPTNKNGQILFVADYGEAVIAKKNYDKAVEAKLKN